jgi:hypothetical protein
VDDCALLDGEEESSAALVVAEAEIVDVTGSLGPLLVNPRNNHEGFNLEVSVLFAEPSLERCVAAFDDDPDLFECKDSCEGEVLNVGTCKAS